MNQLPSAFWSVSIAEMLQKLQFAPQGLTNDQARERLARYGSNLLKPKERSDALTLLLSQFKSPIILILLFAAALSLFLHDPADALIILTIVFMSGLLGFWQERGAAHAVEKLLAMVQTKAVVLRDGSPQEIPAEEVVPGDVIILSAGGSISGDCLILESKDLFVNEASLTGETYPVEKTVGVLAPETSLSQRNNALFMGTHVVSGTGKALVVRTGTETEFGKVSERLKLRPSETDFQRGVRRFGYFLMKVTLVLVIRSRKPFFKSIPGMYLLIATLLVAGITVVFPFTPLGKLFGFSPLPISFLLLMGLIVVGYIVAAELVKRVFYEKVRF